MGDDQRQDAPPSAPGANPATAASLAEGDQQVDIHKPKPVHSWREFLGEIGVIVVGVLIALSAEQAVEAWHWSHVVEDSEAAMKLELLRDDLPQAYVRDAITPCLASQLAQLRELAKPGQSGQTFRDAALRFSPPDRTWTMNALKATEGALAGHMTPERMINWSLAYDMVPFLQRAADREQDGLRELRRSNLSSGTLSPAQAAQLSNALDDVEAAQHTQQSDAQTFLVETSLTDVELSPEAQARLLRQARKEYGECTHPSDLAHQREQLRQEMAQH